MMTCNIVALLVGVVIVGGAMKAAHGGAIVSGTVFCDQCKDGRISLFDYPLYGVNVGMVCPAAGTPQMQVIAQDTTNMFGGYNMRFDGAPDFSGCYTQVSAGGGGSCQASAGPAQSLSLTFSFFGMEFYSADPLISQPAQPMSFCPAGGSHPPDVPVAGPAPPSPFLKPSACPHQVWMRAEYRCHWRVVKPDMKVGVVFGPLAAQKYGGDITLWAGLQGRADPYRTLLREGLTSLLNSYYSLHFPYTPIGVLQRFNTALIASPRTTLLTALRFKRANSAYAASCNLRPCKY